ncbi:MAG: nitrous oxide metabolic protein NosY [Ignavibacteria bacterium]|nr:MAG: nitrous oxide metabolic protein NosY [Ignavibacteria bacterium]
MKTLLAIIKFQFHDTLRSKWLAIYTLFFLILSYALLSFTKEPGKVILSLLNINMIVIPLTSLVFGTIYLYSNRDYIILILSQPINRKVLFVGLYLGLSLPMAISFLVGTGIPLLIFIKIFSGESVVLLFLFLGGIFETFIFVSISFLIASLNDNKMKGLGLAIFLWLFFSALYDGLVLIIMQIFMVYPIEVPAIVLTMLSPIDLARLLVILNFDISALLGYTGAVYSQFLGSTTGLILSLLTLCIWVAIPFYLGLRCFNKKDF